MKKQLKKTLDLKQKRTKMISCSQQTTLEGKLHVSDIPIKKKKKTLVPLP
uniref:Uncharacterized protein n=1 Tax=Rhizophora mucronata TaxID=61149 RepID=A0A2P2NX99_RHIMU